jgi:hypothetical protein
MNVPLSNLIIELNEKMNKLQQDHCVTITQLHRSLKDTEERKWSLERIIDELKTKLDQTSNQNVFIHPFNFSSLF